MRYSGQLNKTQTEYQEELSPSKEENDCLQRLLEVAVIKHEIRLHIAGSLVCLVRLLYKMYSIYWATHISFCVFNVNAVYCVL